MSKRRTTAHAHDLINRSIKTGDVVAVAVANALGPAATSQTLVEVEKIYLDDSKGRPYQRHTFYRGRDRTLRHFASDDPDRDASRNPVITPEPSWELIAFVPTAPMYDIGAHYTGPDEIVTVQDYRLVGRTLDAWGQPTPGARATTYEIERAVRVLTAEQLAAWRAGTLADR